MGLENEANVEVLYTWIIFEAHLLVLYRTKGLTWLEFMLILL